MQFKITYKLQDLEYRVDRLIQYKRQEDNVNYIYRRLKWLSLGRMIVSLDTMLKMNKSTEWELLFRKTENMEVCIKDDVVLNNSEMESLI